jgi:hypothetical protein
MEQTQEKPQEVKIYSYNTAPGRVPDWASALALIVTVIVVLWVIFSI